MLAIQFSQKLQTRTLKAASLTTTELRLAGFRWQSSLWLADETPEAHAIHARIQRILDMQAHEADSATGGMRRSEVICRTETTCDACGRNIGPGDSMLQDQHFTGGSIFTERRCICCYDAAMAAA